MRKLGPLLIVLLLAFLFMSGCSQYNGLVTADENVKKAWSNVQTQYQRRADVFKNVVETVKAAAENEKEILTEITKARSGIQEARDGMGRATTPAELNAQMDRLTTTATNFRIQIEAYPNIRSTEGFLKLQDEISGTENRIATVRDDYNEVVTGFNVKVRRFPANLFAKMFGFDAKEQFEAKPGSEDSPDLNF